MIKYDANLRNELDKLISDYESIKTANPEIDREGIVMMLCSDVLRKELEYNREREFCEYNRLPNELKEEYDLQKSKHPNWNHAKLMAYVAITNKMDEGCIQYDTI